MSLINSDWSAKLLKKISENDDLREIELFAGVDKQKFSVHRLIMMSASNYFHALLGPNFKEGQNNEVTIADIDGVTLKSIIDFCYTGKIFITDENIAEIIAAASRTEMIEIEKLCESYWMGKLNIGNAVELLMLADKYSLAKLRKLSFIKIRDEFDSVSSSQIEMLDYSDFIELVRYDGIESLEEDVCTKVIQWLDFDEERISKYATSLLNAVHLDKIPVRFLLNVVENFCMEHDHSWKLLDEYRKRLLNKRNENVLGRHRFLHWSYCYMASCESSKGNVVNIDKYNAITDRWEQFQKIRLSSERKHFEIVLLKTGIFIIGGMVSGSYVKSVDRFDPETLEYTPKKYEMNRNRGLFMPIAYNLEIFMFGGWNGIESINECESLNLKTKARTVLPPMNQARFSYASAQFEEKMYVAGGKSDVDTNLSSVECYDIRENKWTELSEMNHPRENFALVPYKGYLYAIGYDKTIERYDPKENLWTVIGLFDGSDTVCHAVYASAGIYVLMRNGEFGKFKPDFGCSLVPLSSTVHACDNIYSLLAN